MKTRNLNTYWLYVSFFICYSHFIGATFSTTPIQEGILNNTTKVSYRVDDAEVGFAYYTKIIPYYYALHTLYVHPEYRNSGHGTKILTQIIEILKQAGAHIIYIQPGPFEIQNNIMTNSIHDRTKKIGLLVKLYQKVGFQPVGSWASTIANALYKVIGIAEDARYLMHYNTKK